MSHLRLIKGGKGTKPTMVTVDDITEVVSLSTQGYVLHKVGVNGVTHIDALANRGDCLDLPSGTIDITFGDGDDQKSLIIPKCQVISMLLERRQVPAQELGDG